jgi:uncharacterized membrane protein
VSLTECGVPHGVVLSTRVEHLVSVRTDMNSPMRELPLDAKAVCTDGEVGWLTDVVVDRANRSVTHVVVRVNDVGGREYLVPIQQVAHTSRESVRLDCRRADLSQLQEFTTTRYVPASSPEAQPVVAEWQMQTAMYSYGAEPIYMPMIAPDQSVPIDEHHVPPGAVAFELGAPVQSSDGQLAGRIVALLLDDEARVRHVVVRIDTSGPAREVFLPLSAVSHATVGLLHLKLAQNQLEELPAVPPGGQYSHSDDDPQALRLVSIVFDEYNQGDQALHLVQDRHPKLHAAVVRKNADGSVSAHEVNDVSTGGGALAGAIVGGVLSLAVGPLGFAAASALGAASGGIVGKVVDRGVPDSYLRELGRALRNGASAVVMLVERTSEAGLLEMLAPMGGKVLRLDMDDEMVRRLIGSY